MTPTCKPNPAESFNLGDLGSYSTEAEHFESGANPAPVTEIPVRPYVPDLPDFRAINDIPIVEVAREVGFEVEGTGKKGKIVCPRLSEHPEGTSRYLTLFPTNNKVVCQGCDTYPMSVLDMVQTFGEFNTLRDAAEFVAIYYPGLPRKPKASFMNNPKCDPVPAGCRDPWTLLITSGIYAELAAPSQRLLPVLLEFAKRRGDGEPLRVSQRAMMQYSGIASFTPISEALTELAMIGLLERLPVARRRHSPERDTAEYIVTPLSPRLRKFAEVTCAKLGEAVRREKAIRSRERLERDRKRMFPSL
jgi:hypothetical protein